MPGVKDAGTDVIHQNYFYAGASIDPKLAVANSHYSSQAMDFRSVPSQISVLPGMRTLSDSLSGLITAMEQDLNGIRYGVDTLGNVYSISTNNVVSRIFSLSSTGSSGILYNSVSDQLYIAGQQTVSLYGQLTNGTPKLRIDQFAQTASNAPGVTNLFNSVDGFYDGAFRTTAASTYKVKTSISEAPADLCFFAPDIEPFYSIKVFIVAKGTGNWTLTLHDSLNNSLASVTVTNVNLVSGKLNEFKFSSPIRALVNASQTGNSAAYHWHITSTVADGTIQTVTLSDLSTANFQLYAYALVQPNNGLHPMALFTGSGKPLLCIGNANYLATYDFSSDDGPTNQQFVRHFFQFKAGEEACGITTNNQYLVIAVERRSKAVGRNIQAGALYFWDGTTSNPTFKVDIPMGAPYGIYTSNNVTYFTCSGALYAWSGGQTVIKVRKLAYENTDYLQALDKTFLYPNMMTSRYGILMIGYPSITTNPNTQMGVWSWGAVELTYPNSYGNSYSLANGLTNYTAANNLQIGCVQNFVDDMYTSWQFTDMNGITHYGLDIVDNFSTPAANFNYYSLIYDGGAVYKQKKGVKYKIRFLPMPAGYTLQAFYIINRGTPVYSPTAVQGDQAILMDLTDKRFNELQWGYVGTNNGATVPLTIIGVTMETNPLPEEVNVRRDE